MVRRKSKSRALRRVQEIVPGARTVVLSLLLMTRAALCPCEEREDLPLDPAAEVEETEAVLASGGGRQAIERLKPLVRGRPGEPLLARLLAKAYLAENNPFWAERTLLKAIENNPEDGESRAWLAWVQVSQGDPKIARKTLDAGPSPGTEPEIVRRALLKSLIAHVSGDPEGALESLSTIAGAGTMYQEDRELWDYLWRKQSGWIAPLSARVEVELGHTSDSTAGSPLDPGESGVSSRLARINVFSRLVGRRASAWRPSFDASVKSHGVEEDAASEFSYLELSLRPGVVMGRRRPVLLAYRIERLIMNSHPSKFYEGHRLETEFDIAGISTFMGAGRRTYRDPRRTRFEIDGGFGGMVRLSDNVTMLLGGAVRYFDADHQAYDQRGATILTLLRFPAGPRLSGRLGLRASFDDYPHSGGNAGWEAYFSEEKRRDRLKKASFDLWRKLGRIQLGIRFQYNNRDSTINSMWSSDYEYTERRAMILFRWQRDFDPWAPRPLRPAGHVRLEYGLEGDGDGDEERILDLLRQDEDLRRGSQCPVGP